MVLPDSYPLLLQSEIITNVQGCSNLAVLDAASFFYQWLLHPDHRFMFTVVTHRGQETFQVPIMGYINSVAYVQHEIDNILQDVRAPRVDRLPAQLHSLLRPAGCSAPSPQGLALT